MTSNYIFALNNPVNFIDRDGNVVISADGKPIIVSEKNGKLTFSDNADIYARVAITTMYMTNKGKTALQAVNKDDRKFIFAQLPEGMKAKDPDEVGLTIVKEMADNSLAIDAAQNTETALRRLANPSSPDYKQQLQAVRDASDKTGKLIDESIEIRDKYEEQWDENSGYSISPKEATTFYLFIDFNYVLKKEKGKSGTIVLKNVDVAKTDISQLLRTKFDLPETVRVVVHEATHGPQRKINNYKPIGNQAPYKQGAEIPYRKREHEVDAEKAGTDAQKELAKKKKG